MRRRPPESQDYTDTPRSAFCLNQSLRAAPLHLCAISNAIEFANHWLFEVKWDGFRSILRVQHGRCRLISRNGNEFKSFCPLNEALGVGQGRRTCCRMGCPGSVEFCKETHNY